MEKYQEIERSIIKKFRKRIWSRFTSGIKEFDFLKEGDRIAVCMSGGKDSMLLAKCMQEIQRHGTVKFDLEFLVMNPGYSEQNRQIIENNCKLLNIPIKMFDTKIFDIVTSVEDSPCYLCARMRRGYLYSKAKQLGCNKIALGHHFDDVIETILMNMLYAGEVKTMMPKLHSTNFEGMQIIRPLYLVKEADIIAWKNYNGLNFIRCACRFTENLEKSGDDGKSKREEMKSLIKSFRKISPYIDSNIFKCVYNVNLETLISYRKGDEKHHFMDEYDLLND